MRPPGAADRESRSFFRELGDGWHAFSSRTWLWATVMGFAVLNAVYTGSMGGVLGPLVAETSLGGAAGWGVALGAQIVGLAVGGVIALGLRPARPLAFGVTAVILTVPILISLALVAPWWIVAALAMLSGIGTELFGVLWDTTLQQKVPRSLLSRVASYDSLGTFVVIPLALALAGQAASTVGVASALSMASGLMVVSICGMLLVPSIRRMEGPTRTVVSKGQ